MFVKLLVFIFLSSFGDCAPNIKNIIDKLKQISYKGEDANYTDIFDIKGFLNDLGYPFERHETITEDGYILGIHRIPHGKNEAINTTESKQKPAVLLMHGLFCSSVDYFIFGPERSIALMLADEGYDVWLGNNRGNTWSRNHTSLDPNVDKEFWDYSFHEFGVYDNPAIIDYILNATENEKVSYIGHSEGTTQFFIMGSMRPEYNDKINVMAALAPIAYMGNATSPLVLVAKKYDQFIYELVDYLNLTWLLSYSKPFADTLELLCSDDSDFQEVCVLFVFTLCGFDNDQMDRSMFSKIFKSTPAGISVYQLTHYLQEIVSGHFRQYDYGSTKNLEIYNTTEPPDYDLAAVSAPLALFYSQNDFFAALSDVERLKETLPNVVEDHLMEHKFFNHLDFIYGKDVGSLVYFNVVNVLNAHNNLGSLTSKATTLTTDSMSSDATSSSYSSDSTDLTTSVSPTTEGGATTSFSSMQLLYGIVAFVTVKFVA